ncbi:tyrosine-type recombinase/integrase [Paludisphaera mucosa]|uniref:Site-specific integrase n=1 Tax=Paludisphaera mucosa TaxID=3030827 RepID=A0ABT6FGK3_9BACT|nr:site-specific integrase [Paludisphaera mucosa]MDG3006611.1 site-specific integrase [Paludisphaera mucosa]
MPKLGCKPPAYRRHKATGRARVRYQGKDHYLPGKFGSPESRQAYARFIAGLASSDSTVDLSPSPSALSLTISELILRYADHAEGYYRKNGEPTGEHDVVRYALRPLEQLYGLTLAVEFGPKRLALVRDEMIRRGGSRRYINAAVGRIRRVFRWAVAQEMTPGTIVANLAALSPLQKGRSAAREKPAVAAVSDARVDAALPFLSPRFAAVVRLMRLTGMRPGEALSMRVEEVDRTDPGCWSYRPGSHKTEHRDKDRVVFVGPRAREALLPWIVAAGTGPVFPSRIENFRRAIRNACAKAGVPSFAPNQLRHAFATEVRARLGLEAAQVALGHSAADVTQVYAERDLSKARSTALAVG